MTYMIVSVNGTWLAQSAVPNNLSLQPWTLVRAMTAMGLLNEEVKKKYDSTNLQPKMRSQREMDAMRGPRPSTG